MFRQEAADDETTGCPGFYARTRAAGSWGRRHVCGGAVRLAFRFRFLSGRTVGGRAERAVHSGPVSVWQVYLFLFQRKDEAEPAFLFVFHRDVAAVEEHGMLHDGQPQSGSAGLA